MGSTLLNFRQEQGTAPDTGSNPVVSITGVKPMKKLCQLQDEINEAESAYETALKKKLKPGRLVYVTSGNRFTPAEVIEVFSNRVRVKSATGKLYSVYATRLSEHDDL